MVYLYYFTNQISFWYIVYTTNSYAIRDLWSTASRNLLMNWKDRGLSENENPLLLIERTYKPLHGSCLNEYHIQMVKGWLMIF